MACELELWAEAFRSVEDIQALITLAKKAPKQQLMATYYARLTQVRSSGAAPLTAPSVCVCGGGVVHLAMLLVWAIV